MLINVLLTLLTVIGVVMIIFGGMTDWINKPTRLNADPRHQVSGRLIWIGGIVTVILAGVAWWSSSR